MANSGQRCRWFCAGGADGGLFAAVLYGALDMELVDMTFGQKKLIDSLVEDLLRAIHEYDDSLYMATVIGCLEFVKQQLIDEANEDKHD